MKKMICSLFVTAAVSVSLMACSKEDKKPEGANPPGGNPDISGKVVDALGNPIAGVKVVAEHTVFFASYVYATSNAEGNYSINLPADPAGSWTIKAQVERQAYGQTYKFDLHPSSVTPVKRGEAVSRNLVWKLSGQRPGSNEVYGAHLDLYQFGADVDMTQVKLIFTPLENKLIDGSNAVPLERNVEDVAGTFMVRDIPIGKYSVKAVYPNKVLLLDNRDDNEEPAVQKTVIFGKKGFLAETEYNAEFWLSE